MFKLGAKFDSHMKGDFLMTSQRDIIEAVVSIAFMAFFAAIILTGHNNTTLSPVLNMGFGAVMAYWFTKSGINTGQASTPNTSSSVTPTTEQVIASAVSNTLTQLANTPAQNETGNQTNKPS